MKTVFLIFLAQLFAAASLQAGGTSPVARLNRKQQRQQNIALDMAVYSSDKGVLAQITEERDACGVGFVASMSKKPSHSIVKQALDACTCMEHRGASSADNISGDGAGVLTSIPWKLFSSICDPEKIKNGDGSTACAVGMVFLPKDTDNHPAAISAVETAIADQGLKILGWREVPVDPSVLGTLSKDFVPVIRQVVTAPSDGKTFRTSKDLDSALYEARRNIQGKFRILKFGEAYICSFSTKTIVYKGMLRSCDLSRFYLDLVNPLYESVFAVYHRRFSTNTNPKWFLAQPMRLLAHNGEINTLLGNINWIKSRQYAKRNQLNKPIPGCLIDPGLETRDKFDMALKVKGPLVDVTRSDSANLDSVLESYVRVGGKTPDEALMILVPEAYSSQPKLADSADVQAFYKYYESMQEAWDGPALLVFSDGETVGAALDRNGLRPARYMVTVDNNGDELLHVMSEIGVTKNLALFADDMQGKDLKLVDSGRIGPGEMIAVNLPEGKLRFNDELKREVAKRNPYKKWIENSIIDLQPQPFYEEVRSFASEYISDPVVKEASIAKAKDTSFYEAVTDDVDDARLIAMQSAFGWGTEDVEVQISAMASEAVEATYCMGDDAPLAALSNLPHTLYDYFKQRFAQVTNPPIDPLREGAVMSLTMFLGPRGDPTLQDGQSSKRVKIASPVLNGLEIDELKSTPGINYKEISTLYSLKDALTQGGLAAAIQTLGDTAVASVAAGATILDLTDSNLMAANEGLDRGNTLFIPPLLAVASVHHRLISAGLRPSVSLIVTTGQAWSTHHIACLVGYGASAVVPYAAYDAVINWHSQKRNQLAMDRGDIPKMTAAKAIANYRKAIDKGLLKILSKMGISLLTSYHGAQIFEALGISDEVVSTIFKGTPSRLGGMNLDDIAAEGAEFHRKTFGDEVFKGMLTKVESSETNEGMKRKLFNYGFLNYLKSGEYHHNNQPLIKTLHSALRNQDPDMYQMYEEAVKSRPATTLRDTLQFVTKGRNSIPIDQVESVEKIMSRFCSGGMSLGALSREAHETLSIAMNRIGGKSNSGEGGEDFIRSSPLSDVSADGTSATFPHLKGLQNGDNARSKIKQVASGRFGVTPQYLMSGDQLEIKIAQGAKPGEGGQLPGPKIDQYIATLRKSKPGVTLISPPPHHDIYSIEDLAQLIYDLHQINPKAGVSVKLVSEVGIGTVASGVAKAGADIIQISGHDGGTGASPATSIKHAGSPWELGLVEAHSALLQNGLRDRVLLRVDGGLKSGWDVVMAAAMGGEEFGFGTIAMIAEGCIMARICHTNKCPVGITTQNEELRKRFPGTPENIVTFFSYVAMEVRQILAKLGYRSIEEVIGTAGVLEPREGIKLKKIGNNFLDTSYILDSLQCAPVGPDLDLCDISDERSWLKHSDKPFSNGVTFCDNILADKDVNQAISENKAGVVIKKEFRITNTDRSALSRVSGVIAGKYGDEGFQSRLDFTLSGGAGQSFCAFICKGIDVKLNGYANDYVAKGMAGGSVVVNPPVQAEGKLSSLQRSSHKHSVVGNTVLYGATGGTLLVRGRGGERFAVRNSGATGVVEGLGDHGCEYMTAGTVVCLGNTGRNFAAGMTGGLAFVLDDEDWLDSSNSKRQKIRSFINGIFKSSENQRLEFTAFLNAETVSASKLGPEYTAAKSYLQNVLSRHYAETGSLRAKRVLDNIDIAMTKMWAVVPNSEKKNPIILSSVVEAVTLASTVSK